MALTWPTATTRRPPPYSDFTDLLEAPPAASPSPVARRPGYVRPAGTIGLTDEIGRRVDAYRARAGINPRTAGSFTRGEGESQGDFIRRRNQGIAKWGGGFNRAAGRVFDRASGDWINSDDTHFFSRTGPTKGQWINPQTGEVTTAPTGGGGGSGVVTGAGAGAPGVGTGASAESLADEFLRKGLAGEAGPFDAATISRLSGDAASQRAADLANATEAQYLDSARAGTSFAPAARAAQAAAVRDSREGLSRDVGAIKTTAARENFGARMQFLEREQQNRLMTLQDQWNKASDATTRYGIERRMAEIQAEIQGQKDIAAANAAAASAGAGRGRAWELEDRADQRAYEQQIYERDLPFLLQNMIGF